MGNTHAATTAGDSSTLSELHGQKVKGSAEYAALEEFLQNVRSDRVRSEFCKIPESQYTDINEIRVWASTFNLNGRKPPDDLDLNDYLEHWQSRWPDRNKEFGEGSPARADMYVMGFQEAVPLTAQNIISGWAIAPAGWDNAIDRALNPWKTEEEIIHSPHAISANEKSVIDYYVAGWSGVPSANLEARVKNALAEGSSKQDALMRRGSSFDEKRLADNVKAAKEGGVKSASFDAPDLISFDESIQPSALKSISTPSTETNALNRDASRPLRNANRSKKGEEEHEEFLQLFSHQLVGLYVTGWVRKSLAKRISGVQIATVATGALGYLANKGAISVRFRIDDSAFVFVTSHLASGSQEGDQIRRNLDFSEIVRRTQFPHEVELVKVTREDGTLVEDFSIRPEGIPEIAKYDVKRAFVGGKWGSVRNLSDLDNVIWVGDLNYRINGGRTKDIIQLIRTDKQFLTCPTNTRGSNFIEAPIDFPPTYKFIRGTGYYTGEIDTDSSSESEGEIDMKNASFPVLSKDVASHPVVQETAPLHFSASEKGRQVSQKPLGKSQSARNDAEAPVRRGSAGDVPVVHKKEDKPKQGKKKIRSPAWTDRILWYSSGKQLHQLLYGSFTDIGVSDHKPVVATFLVEARKFNLEKVEAALQDARRNVDVEEMASIPRCKLSATVVEVGMIQYGKPKEFTVTIQNIGEVQAIFSFIPPSIGRHVIRSPFPKWLSAHPASGVIRPGKKEQIRLTISIEGGQWGSADELFGKKAPALWLCNLWVLVGNPETRLDHILVLHVEGGSDFFVSIVGSYRLSCFGIALNNLALQLPLNQEALRRGRTAEKVNLPSLKYREVQPYAMGWELPIREDIAMDLDEHFLARPSETSEAPLQHSSSIAATGAHPNLLEGPIGLVIPSQVSRMLYFFATEDHLKTPHLFTESFKQICKGTDSKTVAPAVTGIREALDEAKSFPSGTTAHDMATALFCFFLELPSPMIPESIAQNCEMSDISAILAMNLVKEAMSAVEWGVFDSTLEIMRSALMEENSKKNRLTSEELARILSQVFFQDISRTCAPKGTLKDAYETPSRKAIVESRRSLFLLQFLKFDKPLISLDEATASVSETSHKSS